VGEGGGGVASGTRQPGLEGGKSDGELENKGRRRRERTEGNRGLSEGNSPNKVIQKEGKSSS